MGLNGCHQIGFFTWMPSDRDFLHIRSRIHKSNILAQINVS